ncbi:MAG: transcription antitermination factor NusB [Desulfovibrio sp.]|uniref:transcription antitermination factor NusB n=1 Tax=Desulfovibrio sp. TaxID=885 RepID=UPI0025BC0C92|nr:transcription antitermination factor NusB [Desulfovibrio sp.]MCI7567947.1 transcription antitermination factor NusB [Desulfovibrio sp.]
MSKSKNSGRRAARAQAFQVLYSLSFADISGEEDVRRAFRLFPAPPGPDGDADDAPQTEEGFAWELVHGVWLRNADLDELIGRFSRNWRVDRLGRVERTLLRLALYEMLYRQDVPAKVAINEALELTRQFGEDNAVSFVNGVLDAAARALEDGSLEARDQPPA